MADKTTPWLGLTENYSYHYPSFFFKIFGWLGQEIGGITLTHQRVVHAMLGVFTIVTSYFFLRIFLKELAASSLKKVASRLAVLARRILFELVENIPYVSCGIHLPTTSSTYKGRLLIFNRLTIRLWINVLLSELLSFLS